MSASPGSRARSRALTLSVSRLLSLPSASASDACSCERKLAVNSPVFNTRWWLYVPGERQTPNRGGSDDRGVVQATGGEVGGFLGLVPDAHDAHQARIVEVAGTRNRGLARHAPSQCRVAHHTVSVP